MVIEKEKGPNPSLASFFGLFESDPHTHAAKLAVKIICLGTGVFLLGWFWVLPWVL